MASLPSPSQVACSNVALYEVYFASVERQGTVPAGEAAKFLKKSGLPDAILGRIWDLSDPKAKGYLNKAGFFAALKLVALAQLGHEVSVANLMMDAPPPKLVGVAARPPPPPTINSVPVTVNDWKMTQVERQKYEALFTSLKPLNGVIPGNKVKGLLSDSHLPFKTLGQIWDLADMDKDGSLDRHEFTVAMHLVYKALENYTIPNTLPPELLPQAMINSAPSSWVVNGEERAKYDNLFLITDVDKDGYVSGHEIKDVFLQSGVPQSVLANIWGLCDIKQSGKLNNEQFALAMWLIHRKLKGISPPPSLTPEMIPPSMRQQHSNGTAAVQQSNPELDMISKDIENLMKDKEILEREVLIKESEIKIKSGEAVSLQGEFDTLAATLKQLDNQKGEAGRRLNDLKNQVDKLTKDTEEQEALVKQQEDELSSKKKELENLKAEETRLGTQQNDLNNKLDEMSEQLQESQLTISQVKTKMTDITEFHTQLKEAIELLDQALGTNDTSVPNRYLELEPDFRDPSYTRLLKIQETEENYNNPVVGDMQNGTGHNSYVESAFKEDPFTSKSSFTSAFSEQPSNVGFDNDPFNSFTTNPSGKSDPFHPFSNSNAKQPLNADLTAQDAFGCEPFGAPALPPKNKQPPPRPAPPRPAPPPAHAGSDTFADFSGFNSNDHSLDFAEDPFNDGIRQ